MPAKKRKVYLARRPPEPAWVDKCSAAIESGDADAIDKIQTWLEYLTKAAKARALDLKSLTVEGWVTMVSSSEDNSVSTRCVFGGDANVREIEATFEVGPGNVSRVGRSKRPMFKIIFVGQKFKDELTVDVVIGHVERLSDDESDIFTYHLSDGEETFSSVSNETIEVSVRGNTRR